MLGTSWLSAEAGALLSGAYPRFVYGRVEEGSAKRTKRGATYLPVFAFHTLDPRKFEMQLDYLQANDYATLTMDHAVAWIRGDADIPARSVVLTIDDGRLTTWTVGLPLLEARGMVATAFVIPGYLEEGPPRPRRAATDGARHRAPAMATGEALGGAPEMATGEPLAETPGEMPDGAIDETIDRRTTLRWSEVEALHDTGVIAIESHTMLHRRVVVSEELEGFIDLSVLAHPRYALPLPPGCRSGWRDEDVERRLGTPIFRNRPILAAREACTPPSRIAHACVERVATHASPGRAFFARPGWKRVLEKTATSTGSARKPWPRRSLEAEQRWELEASRRALEERLPGKRVRHLALPEGAGMTRITEAASGTRETAASSPTAELVRECGYDSCTWAFLPASRSNRPGADPYHIGRLKHDYIVRLPGRRRSTLSRVLLRKAFRRARGRTGF